MKKYIISITCLLFILSSCKEESIGTFPVHSTPPQKISNPIVTNFKGGSTIKYDLPEDKDLLYVKAIYTLPNGKIKEKKASVFINELSIEGYAKSAKSKVSLISVDRSKNESDPVIIEIEPLDSPIFDVLESLSVVESFGGVKLTWENLDQKDIMIQISSKDEENNFTPYETFYTSVSEGAGSVRGMESKETELAINIRDIYKNSTDTLFVTVIPWKETKLDKNLWNGLPLCNSFFMTKWSTHMSNLWDDITIQDQYHIYYLGQNDDNKIFFTIDFGVSAKLSRFKFWGRDNWYFNLHHPKEFEIWGTNDPAVANGDPCSWSGWDLLLTGESDKPSGPEPTAYTDLSTEDLALAHAGEEFEFPLEVSEVRFVRFRTLRTWTYSNSAFLAELTFWGQLDEEN